MYANKQPRKLNTSARLVGTRPEPSKPVPQWIVAGPFAVRIA